MKNVFLKVLIVIALFLLLCTPFLSTKISTALSEKFAEKTKKGVTTISLKTPKTNKRLNFIGKVVTLKEEIEEEFSSVTESRFALVGNEVEDAHEITFKVEDEILFKTLKDKYGATPTGNPMELRMSNGLT